MQSVWWKKVPIMFRKMHIEYIIHYEIYLLCYTLLSSLPYILLHTVTPNLWSLLVLMDMVTLSEIIHNLFKYTLNKWLLLHLESGLVLTSRYFFQWNSIPLITVNSTEHNYFWEASSHSATQKIPHLLWNLKFYHSAQKSLSLVTHLSPHFKIHFYILPSMPRSSK